jgi:hypothetical protein
MVELWKGGRGGVHIIILSVKVVNKKKQSYFYEESYWDLWIRNSEVVIYRSYTKFDKNFKRLIRQTSHNIDLEKIWRKLFEERLH